MAQAHMLPISTLIKRTLRRRVNAIAMRDVVIFNF